MTTLSEKTVSDRRFTHVGAACVVAMALATGTVRASVLDFDLVNQTNQPIVAMWATPTSTSNWGQRFDNTFVPDGGGRQSVRFNGAVPSCRYDLRVQFSEGAMRHWNNLNLCAIRGIRIFVSDGAVTASTW